MVLVKSQLDFSYHSSEKQHSITLQIVDPNPLKWKSMSNLTNSRFINDSVFTIPKIRHLRGFTATAKIVEHYLHQICTSFYNTPVNFSFDSPFSMDTLPTCFSRIKIDQPRLTDAADSIHFQVWLESIKS